MNRERVAEQIRQYRKNNNVTQEQLAQILGLQRNTIVRWETNQVNISPTFMRLLKEEKIIEGEIKRREWASGEKVNPAYNAWRKKEMVNLEMPKELL